MVKRFIAGAVCPRCGEMDRLMSYSKDGQTIRECVACDFSEGLVANVAPSELETRVNQFQDESDKDQISVVNIIEPK